MATSNSSLTTDGRVVNAPAPSLGQIAPDHFIDGVPHRREFVGFDDKGHRVYRSVELEVPAGASSIYWREGA